MALAPTALVGEDAWREYLAEQLVERAKAEGCTWLVRMGCWPGSPRQLETALQTELSERLGYEPGEAPAGPPDKRNGHTSKTVHTGVGPVRLRVPRDRAGSFEPAVVPKHSRRVDGFGEAIISLYAKG